MVQADNHTVEFPYYLRDVPDAQTQHKLLHQFLELTLRNVVCRNCQQLGHIRAICPKYFKLDANQVEQNPKSFFYQLRPPPPVLALRAAVAPAVLAVQTAPVSPQPELVPPPWFQHWLQQASSASTSLRSSTSENGAPSSFLESPGALPPLNGRAGAESLTD